MITDPDSYSVRKRALKASDNLSLSKKYEILEGLYHEARLLGHFTENDLMDGIEDDIRLAAILNRNVSILARIAQALDSAGTSYMVIGGQAVLLYGEPHLTRDIDVTLQRNLPAEFEGLTG